MASIAAAAGADAAETSVIEEIIVTAPYPAHLIMEEIVVTAPKPVNLFAEGDYPVIEVTSDIALQPDVKLAL